MAIILPQSTCGEINPAELSSGWMEVPLKQCQAQIVLPCPALPPMQDFLIDTFGFRVDAVSPADSPKLVLMSGLGLSICLEIDDVPSLTTIRIPCSHEFFSQQQTTIFIAPNGTKFQLVDMDPPVRIPPFKPEFIISKNSSSSVDWVQGRAQMLYRDLLPSRLGGSFIASHIKIPTGNKVLLSQLT